VPDICRPFRKTSLDSFDISAFVVVAVLYRCKKDALQVRGLIAALTTSGLAAIGWY
jgi:hypothetical protein